MPSAKEVFENPKIWNCKEIRPQYGILRKSSVEVALSHADWQTEKQAVIMRRKVAFRNSFVNALHKRPQL